MIPPENKTDPINTPTIFDDENRLAIDLPCIGCQYLLRMQQRDGQCPECGTAVEETLDVRNILLMTPDWVTSIHSGAICFLLSYITMPCFGIGIFLWPLAIWSMSAAPPNARFRITAIRTLAYATFAGWAISYLVVMIASGSSQNAISIYAVPIILISGGIHFALLYRVAGYYCGLARFRKLHRFASFMRWYSLVVSLTLFVLVLLLMKYEFFWSAHLYSSWLSEIISLLMTTVSLAMLFMIFGHFFFCLILAVFMHRTKKQNERMFHAD